MKKLTALVLVMTVATSGCSTIAKKHHGLGVAADVSFLAFLATDLVAFSTEPAFLYVSGPVGLVWAGLGVATIVVNASAAGRETSSPANELSDAVMAAADQHRCGAAKRLLEALEEKDRAGYAKTKAVPSVAACLAKPEVKP